MKTASKQEEIIEKVRAEIERLGLAQGAAAKAIGISPAALSQLLSGSYGADPKNALEKLDKWLAAQAEVKAQALVLPTVAAWAPTPTGEKILATLGHAQIAEDLVMIYGGAGTGKTSTAREYANRYPNVWIATMSPATASVIPALEQITLALGMKLPTSGGAARMLRDLIDRVQGSQGLIIIDEAHSSRHDPGHSRCHRAGHGADGQRDRVHRHGRRQSGALP